MEANAEKLEKLCIYVSSSFGDYKCPEAAHFYRVFAVKKQWSANGNQLNSAICLPKTTTAGEKWSILIISQSHYMRDKVVYDLAL